MICNQLLDTHPAKGLELRCSLQEGHKPPHKSKGWSKAKAKKADSK